MVARTEPAIKTNEELNRQKNNIEGLLELVSLEVPDNLLVPSTKVPNTFGHIGVVVPDIEATQARLDAYPGVNIVKRYGEPMTKVGAAANATGLGPEQLSQLTEEEVEFLESVLLPTNEPLLLITDPDGNIIEFQSQEGVPLS